MLVAGGMKLGQPVLHDAAYEASGMRHQRRKVLSVARARFVPCRIAQPLDQTQERGGVVFGNRSVGAGIIPIGAKAMLGNYDCAAVFVGTIEQAELCKVAGCPAR